MAQEEINKDLDHYLHDKKKGTPIWKKIFGSNPRPKHEVEEDIKEDLEKAEETEDLSQADKQELEHIEEKIEAVNEVEEKVDESIDEKREGLLNKFFKKLNFGKDEDDIEHHHMEEEVEEHEQHNHESGHHEHISNEEYKEFLKKMHSWILQLPEDKLKEFKESDDFEIYKKVLKKHDLIK